MLFVTERGSGFETYFCHVVSLSMTFTPLSTCTGNTHSGHWLHLYMAQIVVDWDKAVILPTKRYMLDSGP